MQLQMYSISEVPQVVMKFTWLGNVVEQNSKRLSSSCRLEANRTASFSLHSQFRSS